MGDRRFDAPYDALLRAPDRTAALRALDDVEVVHALAAASRKMDAYLANVLAVEVLNRQRRHRARMWGAIAGLSMAVVLRAILLIPSDTQLAFLSVAVVLPAGALGYGVYRWLLAWGWR